MTLQLRKLTIDELDNRDEPYCLVRDGAKAYVTIFQAIGFEMSRVKVYNVFEGKLKDIGEDGFITVRNDELHVVEKITV